MQPGAWHTFAETRILKLAATVYNAPLVITPRSKTKPEEVLAVSPSTVLRVGCRTLPPARGAQTAKTASCTQGTVHVAR
jgi:hypothetical protein